MSYQTYPATDAVAITKDVAYKKARAIYVGVGGDINLTVNGSNVLFKNAVAGSIIPVNSTKVVSTNTTATNLIALY